MCVYKHRCRSKFPSTHGNTRTTMATPLPLCVENATDPRCDTAIWVMFLFFFLGVNEGNDNFWDQEINLKGGRIALDFLFNFCYCKIAGLEPVKVRIRTKKQKNVIHDRSQLVCFV